MQALAIIALVLSGIAFFTPVVGIVLALLSSIMAMIAFRSQTTLAAVAFGLNIINTLFFSVVGFTFSSISASEYAVKAGGEPTSVFVLIATYTAIHVVLLLVSVIYKFIRDSRAAKAS